MREGKKPTVVEALWGKNPSDIVMQNKSVKRKVKWEGRNGCNDDVDNGDDMMVSGNDMFQQWSTYPLQYPADDAGQGIAHLMMARPHHNAIHIVMRNIPKQFVWCC